MRLLVVAIYLCIPFMYFFIFFFHVIVYFCTIFIINKYIKRVLYVQFEMENFKRQPYCYRQNATNRNVP